MSLHTSVVTLTLFFSIIAAYRPADAVEIYSCVNSNGALSFSDRPCKQDAQQKITLEPMPMVGWEKVDPPRQKKSPRRRKGARRVDSNKHAADTSACAKTRGRIEKINSRLRAGYTLKAGERLKERLRELESYRFRNCR